MTRHLNAPFTLRRLGIIVVAGFLLAGLVLLARPLWAQKVQESYKDKFAIADETSGVSIATSADGKYVYVAGPEGVIMSSDFGKTGTWVQTVRMK